MSAAAEYFQTGSKKGRGMAKQSLTLMDAMHVAAKKSQPITGRGIGYKLFVAGLIASMRTNDMQTVYRLLKLAREKGFIPWEWIVDETRGLERVATWDDPEEYARQAAIMYRRDFWNQQPCRVQLWSEKGTVRGVLKPVLDKYAVGFNPVHGFDSATDAYNTAQDNDGRPLNVLYVGDVDCSGSYMSEVDLPKRLAEYGGHHVTIKRIALTTEQIDNLPATTREGFPASDKNKDPRYKWFRANHGERCWELDAMDPNDLRDCVEKAILEHIDPVAWARCELVNKAELESLGSVLSTWKGCATRENGHAAPSPTVPDRTPWWTRSRTVWMARRCRMIERRVT
jgi:hypothetical protein